MERIKPEVSIRLMTYNHESFIEDALEGIIAQKTSFPFEIVIGDDCSTDKTFQVIHNYEERYPEKIKVLQRSEQLGIRKNSVDIISHCQGKYIALLDGDDYWIDVEKLQKQVDFLENHQDCSLCFHNVYRRETSDQIRIVPYSAPDFPTITTIEDLILIISSQHVRLCFATTLLIRSQTGILIYIKAIGLYL